MLPLKGNRVAFLIWLSAITAENKEYAEKKVLNLLLFLPGILMLLFYIES